MIINKTILIAAFTMITTALVFSQEVKVTDISKVNSLNNEPTIMIASPKEGNLTITPEILPEFKGDSAALKLFISKNLKYPKEAINNNIQGLLIVQLNIAKDGTATFDKFIRKLGFGCDEEAQRLIKKLPKWNSALSNGKPVDYPYNMMITFKLTD